MLSAFITSNIFDVVLDVRRYACIEWRVSEAITWEVPANWIEFWDAAAADKIKYHMRGSKSHTMFPGSGSSFFANYCSTYGSTIVQNIYGRGNDWFGCQRNEVDHAIRGACWNCCYIMLAAIAWIIIHVLPVPETTESRWAYEIHELTGVPMNTIDIQWIM